MHKINDKPNLSNQNFIFFSLVMPNPTHTESMI